jgi:hypothetical protein
VDPRRYRRRGAVRALALLPVRRPRPAWRGAASKALWALALILLAPFAIVAYLVVRTRG